MEREEGEEHLVAAWSTPIILSSCLAASSAASAGCGARPGSE